MFTLHVTALAVWSCNTLRPVWQSICLCMCVRVSVCVCMYACMHACSLSFQLPPSIFLISGVCSLRGRTPASFFPSSISDKTIEVVEVFGYTQKQSKEWDILKPPMSRPQGRCNSPGVNNVKKTHFCVSGVRLESKRASSFCFKLIIWPEPQALGPLCKLLSF